VVVGQERDFEQGFIPVNHQPAADLSGRLTTRQLVFSEPDLLSLAPGASAKHQRSCEHAILYRCLTYFRAWIAVLQHGVYLSRVRMVCIVRRASEPPFTSPRGRASHAPVSGNLRPERLLLRPLGRQRSAKTIATRQRPIRAAMAVRSGWTSVCKITA